MPALRSPVSVSPLITQPLGVQSPGGRRRAVTSWAEADDSSTRSAQRQRHEPRRVPESGRHSSCLPELGISHRRGQDRAGRPVAHPQLVGKVRSNEQKDGVSNKEIRCTQGTLPFWGRAGPGGPKQCTLTFVAHVGCVGAPRWTGPTAGIRHCCIPLVPVSHLLSPSMPPAVVSRGPATARQRREVEYFLPPTLGLGV